jgi:hypothetical protein
MARRKSSQQIDEDEFEAILRIAEDDDIDPVEALDQIADVARSSLDDECEYQDDDDE